MTQTVEQAQKALWDYINSLPADCREKAIDYQHALEFEANRTEGGMMKVIEKRLKHNTMLLAESMDEVQEIATDYLASRAIDAARGSSGLAKD